jgi:hypothetical protein
MAVNITTAVDSLVELINDKKKISLENASKELGLPEHIVNEWAIFLEEEGIIKIDYKLSTPFLIATIKKELNESDYVREIEIIFRELEVMFSGLNKINIEHKIQIKTIEDVKNFIKKSPKNNSLNNDAVYMQKFVLQYEISELINKIKKLKTYSKKDYDDISSSYESMIKRKKIFDNNLNNIKR